MKKNIQFHLNSVCKEIDSIYEGEMQPFNKAVKERLENLEALKRSYQEELSDRVEERNMFYPPWAPDGISN